LPPNMVMRFLEIFADAPKTIRIYSDNGDEIDIQRIITGDLEPFYRIKIVQGSAELNAGITIDVSGSTRGTLRDNFITMAKHYSALFHYSALRNKGVSFSLSVVGDNYHNLLGFDQSDNKTAVEDALERLNDVKDSGGINTLSVIKGIRKKYAGQPQKGQRLEIIFTDGAETSGEGFDSLRKMVSALEKELDIDIVFIGINTTDVENYSKYINLNELPSTGAMMKMIIQLSMMKVSKGLLPLGDLKEALGTNTEGSASSPLVVSTVEPLSARTADSKGKKVGGINFSSKTLNLQTKKDVQGLTLPLEIEDFENIPIEGLVPVIINIIPMNNLPLLLGFTGADVNTVPSRRLLSRDSDLKGSSESIKIIANYNRSNVRFHNP